MLQPQFGTIGLVPGVLVGAWVFGQARIASRALLLTSVPESRVGRVFGIANAYGLAGTVVVMLAVSAVTDHSDSRSPIGPHLPAGRSPTATLVLGPVVGLYASVSANDPSVD